MTFIEAKTQALALVKSGQSVAAIKLMTAALEDLGVDPRRIADDLDRLPAKSHGEEVRVWIDELET